MPTNVQTLLKQLNLRADEFHYLIVGDGSGSTWSRGVGWAAVCIDMVGGKQEVFYGCANRGSVNVAEILAAQWPLLWIAAHEAERVEKLGQRRRQVVVHIVTDSQYVQTGGADVKSVTKNAALWAQFDTFTRQGITLHWHWLRRNSHPLHSQVDALSKTTRIALERLAVTISDDVKENDSQ